jgi:hypothetical protein
MGEIYTTFLKHRAASNHPAATATPFLTNPAVFLKTTAAIFCLQTLANAILQFKQVIFNG